MPTSSDYEKALNAIEKLYPAAQVLASASTQMQNPNIEVGDIVKLLSTDVSLSTDIVRLSNSAYYGFEVECTNLESAINRVGFREVIRLIGLSISSNMLNQDLVHYDIPAEGYWADSISTAQLMEGFAIYVNQNPQDAYLIGLMHGVGMLVINRIMDDFQINSIWDKSIPVDEWEREVLGFNSGFAGATILKRWNFPTSLCSPILRQMKEPSLDDISFSHTCLYLSRLIIDDIGYGFPKLELSCLDELTPYLESINIDPNAMPDLLEAAQEAFYTVRSRLKSN